MFVVLLNCVNVDVNINTRSLDRMAPWIINHFICNKNLLVESTKFIIRHNNHNNCNLKFNLLRKNIAYSGLMGRLLLCSVFRLNFWCNEGKWWWFVDFCFSAWPFWHSFILSCLLISFFDRILCVFCIGSKLFWLGSGFFFTRAYLSLRWKAYSFDGSREKTYTW